MAMLPSIRLPHYTNEKENRCKRILRAASTKNKNPLCVDIPSRVMGANLGTNLRRGSVRQSPEKARKIYKHLSYSSRRKLASDTNNENMSALISYIRKKKLRESSDKLPKRRRRSFSKKSKRLTRRSNKLFNKTSHRVCLLSQI